MKKNKKNLIIAVTAVLIIILTSCGNAGLPAPEKPTAELPDAENPNRIVLSWKAVDGADIYYIYRSTAEDGTYAYESHSVTSAEVELSGGDTELRYRFIDAFNEGEGGTYWYGVTAASNSDISTSGESTMSPVVSASTYSGTWGTATELGAAAQLKLVADTSALWAVFSTGAGTDAISVRKYAEDENSTADEPPEVWGSITTSMVTNGNVDNPFSIFLNGGELYTVFRDNGQSGTVSMKYYHDSGTADSPSFAWETVGAVGFNGAAATDISAVTVGFGGTIYSGFLEGGSIALYQLTDGAWFNKNLTAESLVDNADSFSLLSYNNSLYIGHEYDATSASDGLYLRAWDGSALQTGGDITSSAIDDGNIDFVSGGGELYAVYITDIDGTPNNGDGSLVVKKYEDNSWTQIVTAGKVEADSLYYGVVDAHWFNGYLYVFYIDSTDSKGWVKYYDEDEGWKNAQRIGGTAVTGTGSISRVQLASAGNTLYAGYIEDDKAYVRILE